MFYRAVIEDNNHPDKNGLVKVRVFGIHTKNNENSSEEFETISTDELPWAEVMGSLEDGLISGIGLSSIPKQGQMVWVFFRNNDYNYPVIMGTITGKQTEKIKYSDGEGFTDPEDIFPFEDRLNEFDINRLTRVEKLDQTIHQKIIDNKDVVTETDPDSGADVTQTEPDSLNDKTIYTNNRVQETECGHVFEFDDSEGNERIRLYHTTGSYIEIRPDGSIIQKSVNEDSFNQYIHYSDVHEHVKKNVKRFIEQNLDEIIKGEVKRHIAQNLTEHVSGNLKLKVDGDLEWDVGGKIKFTSGGTMDVNNGGNHSVNAPNIFLN